MPRQGLDTEQVVQAGVRLADAGGLESATFARIAAALGVRAPSLYNHVKGRPALLRLIALRGLSGIGEAIATAAAGLSGEDAVRATAYAYRSYALANPGCYEATLAAPDRPDPELQAAAERLLELLGAILRAWELKEEQTVDAIRAIRSALHGFVSLERGGGFAMARDREASFARLTDMLVAGLATFGTQPGVRPSRGESL
jgi:AcrR family transcriptional regulator